jgi:hypothetical protein
MIPRVSGAHGTAAQVPVTDVAWRAASKPIDPEPAAPLPASTPSIEGTKGDKNPARCAARPSRRNRWWPLKRTGGSSTPLVLGGATGSTSWPRRRSWHSTVGDRLSLGSPPDNRRTGLNGSHRTGTQVFAGLAGRGGGDHGFHRRQQPREKDHARVVPDYRALIVGSCRPRRLKAHLRHRDGSEELAVATLS